MRRTSLSAVIVSGATLLCAGWLPTAQTAPISLHPDNPHYFLWRGGPTLLITSAEHYGALLNLDFDYRKYLDTLAADGMNNTRLFSGAYCEPDGAINIRRNTLALLPNRFLAPWKRSGHVDRGMPGQSLGPCRFMEDYSVGDHSRAFMAASINRASNSVRTGSARRGPTPPWRSSGRRVRKKHEEAQHRIAGFISTATDTGYAASYGTGPRQIRQHKRN